jgi:hypothetical protein
MIKGVISEGQLVTGTLDKGAVSSLIGRHKKFLQTVFGGF